MRPAAAQFTVQGGLGLPLHATKPNANKDSNEAKSFRKFMNAPRQSGRRA